MPINRARIDVELAKCTENLLSEDLGDRRAAHIARTALKTLIEVDDVETAVLKLRNRIKTSVRASLLSGDEDVSEQAANWLQSRKTNYLLKK